MKGQERIDWLGVGRGKNGWEAGGGGHEMRHGFAAEGKMMLEWEKGEAEGTGRGRGEDRCAATD